MSDASETVPELSVADIAVGDRGRTRWIDLASGRMHEVQLRPSAANPQRMTINPKPDLEAPDVLILN
jgi:hypothetical protein